MRDARVGVRRGQHARTRTCSHSACRSTTRLVRPPYRAAAQAAAAGLAKGRTADRRAPSGRRQRRAWCGAASDHHARRAWAHWTWRSTTSAAVVASPLAAAVSSHTAATFGIPSANNGATRGPTDQASFDQSEIHEGTVGGPWQSFYVTFDLHGAADSSTPRKIECTETGPRRRRRRRAALPPRAPPPPPPRARRRPLHPIRYCRQRILSMTRPFLCSMMVRRWRGHDKQHGGVPKVQYSAACRRCRPTGLSPLPLEQGPEHHNTIRDGEQQRGRDARGSRPLRTDDRSHSQKPSCHHRRL